MTLFLVHPSRGARSCVSTFHYHRNRIHTPPSIIMIMIIMILSLATTSGAFSPKHPSITTTRTRRMIPFTANQYHYHHHKHHSNPQPEAILGNDRTGNSTVQPLIVTIGPPCSGKTTWIRRQQQKNSTIVDVAIDDQKGVYIPLPAHVFWNQSASTTAASSSSFLLYNNQSIHERIWGSSGTETELRLVLQRIVGILNETEFSMEIADLYQAQPMLASILCSTLELYLQRAPARSKKIPSHVDLFMREAIFQPDASTHRTAIQESERQLESVPLNCTVALGNTNTRPYEYKNALYMAYLQRRRVLFIPMTFDNHDDEDSPSLEFPSLQVLYLRNIKRLIETGRYIPLSVIHTMRIRSERLLADAHNTVRRMKHQSVTTESGGSSSSPHHDGSSLQRGLAKLAGFRMDRFGRVRPESKKK